MASDRIHQDSLRAAAESALRVGDLHRAKGLYREALASNPNSFEAAFWLGVLLRESGEAVEALELALKAVELKPGDAPAHGSLASCYSLLHQPEMAVASFERAIELDPSCHTFRHNLGQEFERLARDDEAIACYRAAIALDPSIPNSFVSLGRLLRDRRQLEQATECFARAFEGVPKTGGGYCDLGRAFFDEGIVDEAEKCLRRSAEIDPNQAAAHALLGTVLLQLGRFEEAAGSLERAIALEPRTVRPYIELVGCRKATTQHVPMLERMASMAKTSGVSAEDRRNLHYALGKAFDDLGDYRQAMRHFDEANGLMLIQLAGRRFDRRAHSATFSKMIEIFPEKLFLPSRGMGAGSDMPILIVGMIRSGTTLVEQILSSHPDVAAGGELTFLTQRYQRVLAPEKGSSPGQEAVKFRSDYLDLLSAIGGNKPRVTDKMPHNFSLLGLVNLIFPNARLIHCRRHPVDTCISIYTTPFPQPLNFAHSREEIVFFYKEYLRIMEHWRRVLPKDRFLEVDYEDLVQDRERVTRQMIEFCGLEWDEGCLHHDRNEAAIRTPSWWQARQPVYNTSIGRWRNYEPWLGEFRELM